MEFSRYRYLILSDLFRIKRKCSFFSLINAILFGESYKFIFWMRTCKYLRSKRVLKFLFLPLSKIIYKRYIYKFGIYIPYSVEIDSGFYIGHFGGIIVSPKVKIGKNCNLSHCVTLGKSSRGKYKGYPIIGDNVYIGPGAKIIGSIIIGNNVAIGANCVVTKSIPNNSVVVGIPGKVISNNGSVGYINNFEYDTILIKSR